MGFPSPEFTNRSLHLWFPGLAGGEPGAPTNHEVLVMTDSLRHSFNGPVEMTWVFLDKTGDLSIVYELFVHFTANNVLLVKIEGSVTGYNCSHHYLLLFWAKQASPLINQSMGKGHLWLNMAIETVSRPSKNWWFVHSFFVNLCQRVAIENGHV